jgi:hypothetical protein
MNLDLKGLFKYGLVSAPFLLVSYFSLSSLFNNDVRGLVYVGLVLINCMLTIGIGNFFSPMPNHCVRIPLTNDGSHISNLPLDVNISGFTLGYIALIIGKLNKDVSPQDKDKVIIKNLPTILVLSLLIIGQFVNAVIIERCANGMYFVASFIIGSLLGVGASAIIYDSKFVELKYFNGISNQEVCSRSTRTNYKCTMK